MHRSQDRPGVGGVRVSLVAWSLGAAILGVAAVGEARTFRVEVDFMVEEGAGGHSHQPTQSEIETVQQMFTCQGHTLVVDLDEALPHSDVLRRDPLFLWNMFGYDDGDDTFGSLRAEFFDHDGEAGWHYCIFAHQYEDENYEATTSSGLAEYCGYNFMVTLGAFDGEIGTPFERAATLAHEFGHNLGLNHCGPGVCDGANDSPPNLPSIMSYFYQLRGVRTTLLCQGLTLREGQWFKEIDYSHGRMCTLDERALSESTGTLMTGVDWDCNGLIAGIADVDLSSDRSWCNNGAGDSAISDFDEWSWVGDCLFQSRENSPWPSTVSCVTKEEADAIQGRGGCPQPDAMPEGCTAGGISYVDPQSPHETGTCREPFSSVLSAQANSPAGSVLVLVPGSHNVPSGTVLNRRLTLHCGIGNATIR